MLSQEAAQRVIQPATTIRQRIVGLDVARAIAIFGMIIVHFSVTMVAPANTTGWLAAVVHFWEGRAVAVFVVLAGIGVALIGNQPNKSASAQRWTLIKRGIFLLGLGIVNLVIWPGDILRVYGISFLLLAAIFRLSNRWILAWACGFMLGFPLLMLQFQFDQHWDWATLTYHNVWTIKGFLRNLIFDGFRSVFPWSGLVLLGVWIGRHDLQDRIIARRFVIAGLGAAFVAHAVSFMLREALQGGTGILTAVDIEILFGTASIPPLPLFLLSAGGIAVAMIVACVHLAERFPKTPPIRMLSVTGQLALTWYIGHILVGLGAIEALGWMGSQSLGFAVGCASLFFGLTMVASMGWRQFFQRGPLEWIMRQLVG